MTVYLIKIESTNALEFWVLGEIVLPGIISEVCHLFVLKYSDNVVGKSFTTDSRFRKYIASELRGLSIELCSLSTLFLFLCWPLSWKEACVSCYYTKDFKWSVWMQVDMRLRSLFSMESFESSFNSDIESSLDCLLCPSTASSLTSRCVSFGSSCRWFNE